MTLPAAQHRSPQPTPQVALVATAGLLPFLADLGADADHIMGPAGIDAGRLDTDTHGSLPLAAYVELMERAARLSGHDHFGLAYGKDFPASGHGLISDIALAAPNIGTALRQFADLFPLHQEASQVRLVADQNLLRLEYRILDGRIFDRSQDAELTIAMLRNLLAHAYGPGFAPEEIHFEHPQASARSDHESILGAPVFFAQRTNAILFRPGRLVRPMPEQNPARFGQLLAKTSQPQGPNIPLPDRVRAEIRARLPEGYPPMEDVAEALNIARWTLQRRLATAGLSYSDAVRDVRQKLAKTYLALPHLPITQIAQLLGYAEPSPFTRACRRWFGAPPEQLRGRREPG